MNLFDISAVLLSASAICSYLNYKWIKLPPAIGLLLLAMGLSLLGIMLNKAGIISNHYVEILLSNINFSETIFHGMLSFLLFAGALQINIEDLKRARIPIAITATISTLLSTIIIGASFYYLANLLGFTSITLLYALLFGAIVSPTDPIAVLSIIRKMKASKKIETTFIGESLFNDGVAIAIFLTILKLISVSGEINISDVISILLIEVGGGILFGAVTGWIAYHMLIRVNNYSVELFITLAVASGGYALAEKLSLSAPLAMVVAGIIIGNHGRDSMSSGSMNHVDLFWEALDEILNAVLFFLIGLEMMVINATATTIILSTACIIIALIARFISIAIPLSILKPLYYSTPGTIISLTWGGLRGALSIAMVLSLQQESIKEIFLPCIYLVVIFSIAVQGLTLKKVLKKFKI